MGGPWHSLRGGTIDNLIRVDLVLSPAAEGGALIDAQGRISPSGSLALPETTPVLEASALQDYLRRAQIEPFAWVINGSLAAAQPRDPVLRARAAAEIPQIRKVKELLALRVALIPFQAEEPVGVERLNSLAVGMAEHLAACVG